MNNSPEEEKDKLVGFWAGGAFPGHEVTVVLCQDGSGLLSFFWDEFLKSPFLDEFQWHVESGLRVRIGWRVRHDWVERSSSIETVPGGDDTVGYTLFEFQGRRALKIDIGLNRGFDATLVYLRAPNAFEQEQSLLLSMATGFVPHRAWVLTSDGLWMKAT